MSSDKAEFHALTDLHTPQYSTHSNSVQLSLVGVGQVKGEKLIWKVKLDKLDNLSIRKLCQKVKLEYKVRM